MAKTIDTLIKDVYAVIEGKGGWDKAITEFFSTELAKIAEKRFTSPEKPRDYLSPSMLGSPCDRELWYKINTPEDSEPIDARGLGSFFYGDVLELFVTSCILATDHVVTGIQEEIDVYGIPGAGDLVVDGWVIDIKSASRFAMEKFRQHQLKGYHKTDRQGNKTWVSASVADPFNYISQLSSYLAGYRDNDEVTEKNKAAFLVVNKERFELVLDIYDLSKEVASKEAEVKRVQDVVAGDLPPTRLPAVAEGKSGNYKLDTKCSYCGFKNKCWDNKLRLFLYSHGPVWFTNVVREPSSNVPEVTNDTT